MIECQAASVISVAGEFSMSTGLGSALLSGIEAEIDNLPDLPAVAAGKTGGGTLDRTSHVACIIPAMKIFSYAAFFVSDQKCAFTGSLVMTPSTFILVILE